MAVARRRAKLSVMDWATSFVGPALDRWSISIETSRQTTGERERVLEILLERKKEQ